MEIREFLAAVFGSWVETVGIILTVLPFLEKVPRIKTLLHDKPVLERYSWLLWMVGGFCIFYGFYNAWFEQRQIAKTNQQIIDQLSKPEFEIVAGTSLVAKGTAEYTKVTELRTFIVLPLTVFNHGAPSVIRDIQMTIRFPNGQELRGKQYLPKTPEVSFPGPKGEISFATSSSLFIKGASPIPMGGQADGFVMYELPAGLLEKITETADWIELTIFDVNKKPYTIKLPRCLVPAGEFRMTPGMLERH